MKTSALKYSLLATLVAAATSGCVGLQQTHPLVYDFGPGALSAPPATQGKPLPALVLGDVAAPAALDGTAVLYRLAYADAQQLRPYALARWTMPAAQLLYQRVRERLGQQRTVLAAGEPGASMAPVLRLELEEFSQLFDSASTSSALVRVRATLVQPGKTELAPAQTSLVVRVAAASADAAGGVHALAQASDALAAQLDAWLAHATPERTPP